MSWTLPGSWRPGLPACTEDFFRHKSLLEIIDPSAPYKIIVINYSILKYLLHQFDFGDGDEAFLESFDDSSSINVIKVI